MRLAQRSAHARSGTREAGGDGHRHEQHQQSGLRELFLPVFDFFPWAATAGFCLRSQRVRDSSSPAARQGLHRPGRMEHRGCPAQAGRCAAGRRGSSCCLPSV
ncbi:unnamed protein product [Urochloa humidicola]